MLLTKPFSHRTLIPAVQNSISAALLLCSCILLLLHREAARSGVLTGIYTCLNTLIPSLFPFVLLSCLITQSRAAKLLFAPFTPVMRYIFRLPASAAPALILGLTAGYPIGAKITATLYKNGELDREQASRLLSFCTAPGYAFCMYTAAAIAVPSTCGFILFISTLLSSVIIGIVRAQFAPKPQHVQPMESPPFNFTNTVRDGVSAMTSMCSFVIAFSALLAVLQSSGIFRVIISWLSLFGFTVPDSGALLMYFLEVTAGIAHSAYWHLPLSVTAFGLGFSGLCIQIQLISFFREREFPLAKYTYFLFRILSALCSFIICKILLRVFPAAAAASAGNIPLTAIPAGSPQLSAALLALSIFFLLSCANSKSAAKKI